MIPCGLVFTVLFSPCWNPVTLRQSRELSVLLSQKSLCCAVLWAGLKALGSLAGLTEKQEAGLVGWARTRVRWVRQDLRWITQVQGLLFKILSFKISVFWSINPFLEILKPGFRNWLINKLVLKCPKLLLRHCVEISLFRLHFRDGWMYVCLHSNNLIKVLKCKFVTWKSLNYNHAALYIWGVWHVLGS